MCIITKRGDHALLPLRIKPRPKGKPNVAIQSQAGFTLPEMLVSLCILGILLHGIWQWGTVLSRTSATTYQNQQAVYLAQQLYAGLSPSCPDGWEIGVSSTSTGGLLYESIITIQNDHRRWQFYYVGPEELGYGVTKNAF